MAVIDVVSIIVTACVAIKGDQQREEYKMVVLPVVGL